jgi:ribosomal protein S18 acetylase RimI-like enzyme
MSAPTYTIRDYRSADEAAVVALVRELQAFEAHLYDRLVPASDIGPWYVARILRDCAKHKGRIRLAEQDGAIVGYASIMTDVLVDDERDEIAYSHAYLGDLVVAARVRGAGIGLALMADCEAIARAAGAKWLRISALAGNDRAVALYRKFGFVDQHVSFEKVLA